MKWILIVIITSNVMGGNEVPPVSTTLQFNKQKECEAAKDFYIKSVKGVQSICLQVEQ